MNQHKFLTGVAISSLVCSLVGLSIEPTGNLAIAAPARLMKPVKATPFYSPAGQFSIGFPSEPKAISQKTPEGLTIHSWAVVKEQTLYLVSYFAAPGSKKTLTREETNKLLVKTRSEFTQGSKAKITSSKDIQLDQHFGTEFEFTSSGQDGKVQIYVVGEKVYFLMGMGGFPQVVTTFLNSFRLR